ncbi:cyclic nucleotide-binding domain-containing protein [Singulisphaera sp. PoT]|uniref:cyclic nucleotide-binding domain-containing protein n=1 Tax=Singulisphaera sp. PoT TaxID=3411797 RepID=UPI003BF5FED6
MVEAHAAEQFLSVPLLHDVDLEAKRAILEVLVEKHAHQGTILLHQGQPGQHLSFLIEGKASIDRKYEGGHVEHLARLSAPAVFGTTAFFHPDPPSVSVKALTPVTILSLDRAAHERLRRENPRAAEALALAAVRTLVERFNHLDKRVSESLAQHAHDHPKVTEWSGFRARLFEESSM